MREPQEFNLSGSMFSVGLLEMILNEINQTGGVKVTNVCPGSVEMLKLGAVLAEMARESIK